ncbi:MAG: diadenylate cyclase, partial [Bacteroidales bacterium]|nr:diadenylate cyclase [Bacteroidales bacterium]
AHYGMRHKAAVGISEVSDADVVVGKLSSNIITSLISSQRFSLVLMMFLSVEKSSSCTLLAA